MFVGAVLLPAMAAAVARDASSAPAGPPPAGRRAHPLLGQADDAVLAKGGGLRSTAEPRLEQVIEGLLASDPAAGRPARLAVDYPLEDAVFPPEIVAPTFRWHDPAPKADTWLIDAALDGGAEHIYVLVPGGAPPRTGRGDPRYVSPETAAYRPPPDPGPGPARTWVPGAEVWAAVKKGAVRGAATVSVLGFASADPGRALSHGQVRIRASKDPVGAPIFYRHLPLPFIYAVKRPESIEWRLGDVASPLPPPTLLTDMRVCGNCHSFSADGKVLAMDVDYGNDKGSYVIADVERETVLDKSRIITWTDYRREDNELTFGLLSQVSPDGRYVVSMVKDRSVFSPVADIFYSQRFFPIKGILVVYDRRAKTFLSLPGADDPKYVQSNPAWSPDGTVLLFARADAYELKYLKDPSAAIVPRDEVREFFDEGKPFRYDLYRVPFNGGKGGPAEPLRGASNNGRSNYFPKFSPDGRWVAFCQADNFSLLRPDSLLYIMPAEGGTARRMRCNFPGSMNSWHSWSPNGRWLVFSSKVNGPFTQLWLTHVDEQGNDAPPVLLELFTAQDRAANIPEFVNRPPEQFVSIRQAFADYYTYYRAGVQAASLRWFDLALEDFQEALRQNPDHGPTRYWMGVCLAKAGHDEEAIGHLRKGLELEPDSARNHHLLGAVLTRKGRYEEGLAHLETALKANPRDGGLANNIAWVLATCPEARFRNGRRAVELATQVCAATGFQVPALLDSLAAAYAEAGDFDNAVRTATRALELARRDPASSAQAIEARLQLYKAGRPYREGGAPPS